MSMILNQPVAWGGMFFFASMLLCVPLVVRRSASRVSGMRHAKLKWATTIVWGELLAVGGLALGAHLLLGPSQPSWLMQLSLICWALSGILFCGFLPFFWTELYAHREDLEKATRHQKTASRAEEPTTE